MTQFVETGQLPQSFTESRNFFILMIVAIVAIADWVFYAVYLARLTEEQEMETAWKLNFSQLCVVAVILTIALVFLGISNVRIHNLKRTLINTPENVAQLKRYHRITWAAFTGQFLFLSNVVVGVIT